MLSVFSFEILKLTHYLQHGHLNYAAVTDDGIMGGKRDQSF